jgi:hypothetical protein
MISPDESKLALLICKLKTTESYLYNMKESVSMPIVAEGVLTDVGLMESVKNFGIQAGDMQGLI